VAGLGKGGVEKPGQNIFIVSIRLKWAADKAAHLSPSACENRFSNRIAIENWVNPRAKHKVQ